MKNNIVLLLTIVIVSCTSNSNNGKKLIGVWQCDLKDEVTNKKTGKVTLEFTADGKFIQKVDEESSHMLYQRPYRLDGNKLYLIRLDFVNEDQTDFYFENDKLIIELDGVKNDYEKIK
ncbi:hypothetical protein [Flavobacterium sp. PL002]|uniref:hypothetical protein n=1 Tax=Flavobacterium sp. PL002 TaxID=1897058 RepID=UPI001788088C|nr:hypothetical protein [Flavobacterium sp. PL002]MBE0390791.1 hypothetical protein [Flavobacterium sp. PL002]